MKAFSRLAGTCLVALAFAVPAAAQGRGNPPSSNPSTTTSTTSTTTQKPATTTSSTPKTPAPITVPPSLAAKLQPLLPTGTDVATASTGFKNLGQFVAAVHVSKNLDIPFDTLKGKMTGTSSESLGKAIH